MTDADGTETVRRYVYDGEDIRFELDGSGTILTEFIHGPGIDEPLVLKRGGRTYHYRTDALGSVVALTDDAGQLVQRYTYSAYGEITSRLDPEFAQPYAFTGREYDAESGLYYYRARYYDPAVGRFLTRDPIGLVGGVNLYAYVGNNPINWADPFGLEILICSRPVQGFPFIGNHTYAIDTTTGAAEGMRGSSGSGMDSRENPHGDACNVVEGSAGKEKDIMNFLRENQNNGIWAPFANDCQNAVRDAVGNAGLNYPGAPGDRFGAPEGGDYFAEHD